MPLLTSSPALPRRALLALPLALALALGVAAPAQAFFPVRAADLSPSDQALIREIQTYLNGIKTLQSHFEQVAADGGKASGTIYLERPDHLRLVYDAPSSILIVATQGQIYYYDPGLQQVSQIDVKDTPAWFLLRNNITLGDDVTVTALEHHADTVRLTMVQTTSPERGRVTMVLTQKPLQLRQWTVIDAQNKEVTVTLDSPQYGVTLAQNLFQWSDPRPAGARDSGG
jgi:outer membrane lipoprotein-sorting protein